MIKRLFVFTDAEIKGRPKMRERVYQSDDEWRTVVILNLVGLRKSICELGGIVAVIAFGAFAARWWDYAPIFGAGVALFGAVAAFRTAGVDYEKLADLHFAADRD
jgi:hypothetical protein